MNNDGDKEMISAKEARNFRQITLDDHLRTIDRKIKNAAKTGSTIILRDKPYCDWLYRPQNQDEIAKEVLKTLEVNGYTVSLYYEEKQLVDYGLKISW